MIFRSLGAIVGWAIIIVGHPINACPGQEKQERWREAVDETVREVASHKDPAKAGEKIRSFGKPGIERVVEKLVLDRDKPEEEKLVLAAENILIAMNSPDCIPSLMKLLRHEKLSVSAGPGQVLSRINVPKEWAKELLEILESQQLKGQFYYISRTLANMGAREAAPTLRKLMASDEAKGELLEECLACLEMTDYLKGLLKDLEAEDPKKRIKTLRKLVSVRSKLAVPAIMKCLDDPRRPASRVTDFQPRVCDEALSALSFCINYPQGTFVPKKASTPEELIQAWKEWWEKHKDDPEYK